MQEFFINKKIKYLSEGQNGAEKSNYELTNDFFSLKRRLNGYQETNNYYY